MSIAKVAHGAAPFQHVLEAIAATGRRVHRTGADKARAVCIGHAPDRKPSLSLTWNGHRLLMMCHTGCSQDALMAALGTIGLKPS